MATNDDRRAPRFGSWAEDEAARLLARLGFRIVARNWRTRRGEVDVVARRGNLLVFVEVKAREREDRGTAAEAVTPAKRRRLAEAASAYLAQQRGEADALDVRFDVVTVTRSPGGGLVARHVEGAFDVAEE
jgi:putative endonuclease